MFLLQIHELDSMSIDNFNNNKSIAIWAFLIGLMMAFILMFICWFVITKFELLNTVQNACGCGNNKISTKVSNNHHMNKCGKFNRNNIRCTAHRHKRPNCFLHRSLKLKRKY